ncbi:penicillin-binding transpeptidase domain-containing protein [Patulibacter minatonensis]|uniref:penicillin-binding transpeptidase domain-containing protein n=1 Tax=Patulibacter minatonensis TaxID=298163 RepID=UPI00047E868C|nr:penicillin-binding transpeptidase domain-containing protein [Patulibacter minatonensis]
MRIAAFGIVAFGVFAILFLRLWFLQVLQGDQYRAEALRNGERIVRTAAPRGAIVDRERRALVTNEAQTVVTLRPEVVPDADRSRIAGWGQAQGTYDVALQRGIDRIVDARRAREAARAKARSKAATDRLQRRLDAETPAQFRARTRADARRRKAQLAAARRRTVRRLARTGPRDPRNLTFSRDASPGMTSLLRRLSEPLEVSPARMYRRLVTSVVRLPYADIPLKSTGIGDAQRNFLLERRRAFPEIEVKRDYRRHYVDGGIASQLYGTVNEITASQLKERKYAGLQAGQKIGQDGLEFEYNAYLQGKDGAERIEVDAQGRPTGRRTPGPVVPGLRLQLSLDSRLQRTAERAIAETIHGDTDSKTGYRAAGSFVAMDPRNGELLATGSYPTVDLNRVYDPSLARRTYARMVGRAAGAPLYDRATRGQYAIGSTFKIVTALAGLSSGLITPGSRDGGGACIKVGREDQAFCNAGKADLGTSNLERALQVSSDVYFYEIGRDVFQKPGQQIQSWARRFGYGRPSGVDLPGESPGVIPDAKWRTKRNAEELACRKQRHVDSCGLVFSPDGQFLQGDNINLAIGQGDFLATPLQVAVSYAGLYDPPGSSSPDLHFPTPHLGMEIQESDGRLRDRFKAAPRRTVRVPDPSWKKDILDGLHEVTSTSAGTAGRVFSGWDQGAFPVYGKTGTAQRCATAAGSTCPDQAWFAAMVPDRDRPIVVVATVENGEFGATTAGPIVCRVLRAWYRQSSSSARCTDKQGSVNRTE